MISFLLLQAINSFVYAQECEIIHVTTTGASSGIAGTRLNPASLSHGLSLVNSTHKRLWLATGTYSISSNLTLTDSLIIEGGFNSTNWSKSNAAKSIIVRDNTNLVPANALIGIEGNSISGFRLQDISIVVDNAPGNEISVYGLHLSNCSNYSIVRCEITTGAGSRGLNGSNGTVGQDGNDGQNSKRNSFKRTENIPNRIHDEARQFHTQASDLAALAAAFSAFFRAWSARFANSISTASAC